MNEKKIIYVGTVLTMNYKQPTIEAIGIEGEKIVAVGTLKDVKHQLYDAELINLEGKTILPGFYDCHCHPIAYLFFLINLNLRSIKSYKEFKEKLKLTAKEKKPGEWIFGLSYDELNFEDEKILPDKWILDEICPKNPVFILRFDGHIGIGNSQALELAGIDANSIPPEGCEYRKNSKGELTGEITEKAVSIILS